MIDLSLLRGVYVDPRTKTARAGGGATWGDYNYATHAYGLASPGGIVSTTGIGGLTLGGGIGHLSRGFGLSIDNLISAEVVTADGQIKIASKEENPDLFWAIRGGGGNFGVATSFEYQLHPVQDVYVGLFFYELDQTAELFRFYREFIRDASRITGRSRPSRSRRRFRSSRKIGTGTHWWPPSSTGRARSTRARTR